MNKSATQLGESNGCFFDIYHTMYTLSHNGVVGCESVGGCVSVGVCVLAHVRACRGKERGAKKKTCLALSHNRQAVVVVCHLARFGRQN